MGQHLFRLIHFRLCGMPGVQMKEGRAPRPTCEGAHSAAGREVEISPSFSLKQVPSQRPAPWVRGWGQGLGRAFQSDLEAELKQVPGKSREYAISVVSRRTRQKDQADAGKPF